VARSRRADYTLPVATNRASALLLCSLLLSGTLLSAQTLRDVRDVVVGYYDAEPSCWRAPDGEPRGVFVELLDRIALRRGWKVRWAFRTWDELIEGLKSGEIDVVPAIVRTEAREQFARFVRGSVMLDWGAAMVRRGAGIETVLDLDGRRVGHLPHDFWFEGPGALSSLARSFGVAPEYVPFQSYRSMMQALGDGSIDAAAGSNSLVLVNGERYGIAAAPIIYTPVELTYAVSRASDRSEELAAALAEGIDRIKAEDPGYLQAVLSRYSVPIRSEVVLPRWVVLLLILLFALLTALLAVFALQARRISRANVALTRAMDETRVALEAREAYLHETHHRVRNNLQLIVSLLRLQSDAHAGTAFTALQEAKRRVLAISAVEDSVYEAGNLDAEAFRSFLSEFVASIAEEFGAERFEASCEVDLGGERLPPGAAAPLALIVNELSQNACLHGRGPDGRVVLSITLSRATDGRRTLEVRDAGPGFPAAAPGSKPSGL